MSRRYIIDLRNEIQRFDQRQIPPQLCALTEDHTDVSGVIHALFVRVTPKHMHSPTRWHENASQHFDGGGFARAVHSDVAYNFARIHLEVNAVDRCFLFKLWGK